MKRLTEMASPHWDKLSPEEKEKYKKNSVSSPNSQPNSSSQGGESMHEENARLKAERKANELMVSFIKNLVVEACDSGGKVISIKFETVRKLLTRIVYITELDSMVFHFITTSSFHTTKADIYPAELAIAKFSLKEGIIDDFQIHINPGKLPLGASLKALEKSQATHKYPLPPCCTGEGDYFFVLESIVRFLHPMDKLPIFFTHGNTRDDLERMLETCRTIKKIFYESREDGMLKSVKVYPIDELFFMLQKVTVTRKNSLKGTNETLFPSIAYASSKLKENRFVNTTKGCEFHDDKKVSIHCCLSQVRRLSYIIASWCSTGQNFELKKGKHFP